MALDLDALVCRSDDPARAAFFWAGLLDRETVADEQGWLLPGTADQMSLRFVPGTGYRTEPNPVHLHVVAQTVPEQAAIAAAATRLGATPKDVGQRPDEDHIVLADVDGNEFCVLLTNGYLAGTGLLGEIACEGSHDVGLFWQAALGWPLVWDRDGETVVQRPVGGTKLAWSGAREITRTLADRYYLDIRTTDPLDAEVDRLVTLGATPVPASPDDGAWWLADVDGTPFSLRTASAI